MSNGIDFDFYAQIERGIMEKQELKIGSRFVGLDNEEWVIIGFTDYPIKNCILHKHDKVDASIRTSTRDFVKAIISEKGD